MAGKPKLIVAASLAGIVLLGGVAWYINRAPSSAPPPAEAASNGSEAVVETAAVRIVAMADEAAAVGTLRSNESVVLRPEVSGRISAILFREGTPVKRGAVLVELDAAVQRAELQQTRAELALAESNSRRTEDLFERRFVSQSARDESASRLEVARAAVELADARYRRMILVAPFDGIVGIRQVSVGDFVKDGDPLVNLEDISVLKVDFRLPETLLPRLRVGQALEVGSDSLPGERFAARVDAIDPLVDAQGRAAVIRASLANPEGRLRPGMFARVRLILQERPAVAAIPEEALVPAPGDAQFVYRVVDGRAERVNIRTGARRESLVEVVEGLAPGDEVVTAGQLKLREGAAVRVVADAAAEAAAD
ncbi:efflux RND transporter periplasmic adaptor subunit [Pseudothauera rhizosphaerae]|uniref:Efflux RND transporter periplasmic adaptor subunit n=1 Tax=Pseudothauera rhizosphaerae TaxID=2565932 RepID=A0A4S4ATH6_9RHOO|nr:efflux RND transporter periplasmic adaptor subunit [Pseudothauera rhizosphaerae]THF63217.1 efflux RND transporter periplasmic adaptor subunit [Pseudothauera rhizosphaerae]